MQPSLQDSPRRRALRWLYSPWSVPVVWGGGVLLTVTMGSLAIAASVFGRRAASRFMTAWGRAVCWTNFTGVEVRGRERLEPGRCYVVMPNHSSFFDVFALCGHFGRPHRWVIKKELRRLPVFGLACERIGCAFVDRKNNQAAVARLQEAGTVLDEGMDLMIFPEGTRSVDGQLLPLKKGGFMLALQQGLPIAPVRISGSAAVLPARGLLMMPGRICIEVLPPIETAGYGLEGRDRLMEDLRKALEEGA